MSELPQEVRDPIERGRLVGDIDQLHSGDLAKGGWLTPGRTFQISRPGVGSAYADFTATSRGTELDVAYRFRSGDEPWQSTHYSVALDLSDCPIRGLRYWFLCPFPKCSRRTETLFFGGKLLGCRNCHGLQYPSQQRSGRRSRAIYRAMAIRARLGGELHLLSARPPRPPRMHVKTYERLCAELEDVELLVQQSG